MIAERCLALGAKHAMEADQMQPWTGNQRGQALHELERRHHHMGSTVVVGAFELQHDVAGAIPF